MVCWRESLKGIFLILISRATATAANPKRKVRIEGVFSPEPMRGKLKRGINPNEALAATPSAYPRNLLIVESSLTVLNYIAWLVAFIKQKVGNLCSPGEWSIFPGFCHSMGGGTQTGAVSPEFPFSFQLRSDAERSIQLVFKKRQKDESFRLLIRLAH